MSFDLDKAVADKQGDREPFTFTFDGHEYTLSASLDAFALAAITEGDMTYGLRRILGDNQFEQLEQAEKVFGIEHLDALLEEYAKYMGFDTAGESSASSRLSNRTARRSKPTSKGSTESTSRTSAPA